MYAVADFFRAPDIEEVDLSAYTGQIGDVIRIKATDNFKVQQVNVRIENAYACNLPWFADTNSGAITSSGKNSPLRQLWPFSDKNNQQVP